MIFGSYPCCDADMSIAMSENPGYFRELCPSCGTPVWHKLSRLDPQSWREVDFLKEHRIDEATKTITPINPEPELRLTGAQRKVLAEYMERLLLYGDTAGPEPVGLLRRMRR